MRKDEKRPAENDPAKIHAPRLLIAQGRGGAGKSLLLGYSIERAQKLGNELPMIGDFDRTNRTLSQRYPKVITCNEASDTAIIAACAKFLDDMMASRRNAVIDLGGGDFIGLKLLLELSIVPLLAEYGCGVTFLFPIGSDADYLAPLGRLQEMGLLQGADVVVALNGALADESTVGMSGFKELLNSPELTTVINQGGKVIFMPRLQNARVLAEQRMSLSDAAANQATESGYRLGTTRAFQVRRWLREMDAAFETLGDIMP